METLRKNSDGWHKVLSREKVEVGKRAETKLESRKKSEVPKSVLAKYSEVVPSGAELKSFSATVNDDSEVVGGTTAFVVDGSLNVVQF